MIPTQSAWLYPWPQTSQEARTAKQIAATLVRAGIEAVFVKMADGGAPYDLAHYPTRGYSPTRWKQDVADFRAAGLQVYAWVYLYAANPDEADRAVSVMKTGLFDGLIVDVEGEFERSENVRTNTRSSRLAAYLTKVRAVSKVLAYAPFWKPSVHTGLLYDQWNRTVDVAMPQAYWQLASMTPKAMLDATASDWRSLSVQPKRLIPAGDPNSTATAAEISAFGRLALSRYGAVSWWRFPFSSAEVTAMAALTVPPDTSTAPPTGGSTVQSFAVPKAPEIGTVAKGVWLHVSSDLSANPGNIQIDPGRDLPYIGTVDGARIVEYVDSSGVHSGKAYFVAPADLTNVRALTVASTTDTTPFSQADVDAKVKAATDPLNAEIVSLEGQVTDLTAKAVLADKIKAAWAALTGLLG